MVESSEVASYDGTNAFNMYRQIFLPAITTVAPAAVKYVTNVYAENWPKLLLAMQRGTTEEINLHSRTTAKVQF